MANYPGTTPEARNYLPDNLDLANDPDYADYVSAGGMPPVNEGGVFGWQDPNIQNTAAQGQVNQDFTNAAQGAGMLLASQNPQMHDALQKMVQSAIQDYQDARNMPGWQRILQNLGTVLQRDPIFGPVSAIVMGATNTPYRSVARDPLSNLTGVLAAEAGMEKAQVSAEKLQQQQDFVKQAGGIEGFLGGGGGGQRQKRTATMKGGELSLSVSNEPNEQFIKIPGQPVYKMVPNPRNPGENIAVPVMGSDGKPLIWPMQPDLADKMFKYLNAGFSFHTTPEGAVEVDWGTSSKTGDKLQTSLSDYNMTGNIITGALDNLGQFDLGWIGDVRKKLATAKAQGTNWYDWIAGEKPARQGPDPDNVNSEKSFDPRRYFDPGLGTKELYINSLVWMYLKGLAGQTGRSVSNRDFEVTKHSIGADSRQEFGSVMQLYRKLLRDQSDEAIFRLENKRYAEGDPKLDELRQRYVPSLWPSQNNPKSRKAHSMIDTGNIPWPDEVPPGEIQNPSAPRVDRKSVETGRTQ